MPCFLHDHQMGQLLEVSCLSKWPGGIHAKCAIVGTFSLVG